VGDDGGAALLQGKKVAGLVVGLAVVPASCGMLTLISETSIKSGTTPCNAWPQSTDCLSISCDCLQKSGTCRPSRLSGFTLAGLH